MAAVLTQLAGGALAVADALGFLTIIPQGQIGDITVQATLEEVHTDFLEVTEHPVQFGAAITDHSFKRPSQLVMRCGWTNSTAGQLIDAAFALVSDSYAATSDDVAAIHSQLRAIQESRQPFTVVTTLRVYQNMLLTSLVVTRDEKTSQALMVTATMRSVIIVTTQATTQAAASNQTNPASTLDTTQLGPQPLVEQPQTVITRLPSIPADTIGGAI